MYNLDKFENWMNEELDIASVSAKKYASAVRTIYKKFNKEEKGCLWELSQEDINIFIDKVFTNKDFIDKDTTGKNMYSSALKKYRCFVRSEYIISGKKDNITTDTSNKVVTENEQTIKARRGQNIFRENLLKKYEKKCVITGIDVSSLLVASHIKPWAVSNGEERLDTQNGLLLSSNMDKLFDLGFISFEDSGIMKISKFLSKENIKKLCLDSDKKYDLRSDEKMKKYLKYHRENIFLK